MSELQLGVVLCLVAMMNCQLLVYQDPCHGIDCGERGCCIRYGYYYDSLHIRYRKYRCVCDEGYYWDKLLSTCAYKCHGARCHQFSSCFHKNVGSLHYPGSDVYVGYRDEHYYCVCNEGYFGNGRRCLTTVYQDPCDGIDCGEHGCCSRHDGYYYDNVYIRYKTYRCECDEGYYWDPMLNTCTYKCHGARCHQFSSCYHKNTGSLNYTGSDVYDGYRDEHYYCVCNEGYFGNGRKCLTTEQACYGNDCSNHAQCVGKPRGMSRFVGILEYDGYKYESYYCLCYDGYNGNGRTCRHHCLNNICHQNATCIVKPYGSVNVPENHETFKYFYYYCRCNVGFEGNGTYCKYQDPCLHNNCHANANCVAKDQSILYNTFPGSDLSNAANLYFCRCKDGYYGNGRTCQSHCYRNICHSNAKCISKSYGSLPSGLPASYRNCFYYCLCDVGYQGNGTDCDWDINHPCRGHHCHKYATCTRKEKDAHFPSTNVGYLHHHGYKNTSYYCECIEGYYGNGRECFKRSDLSITRGLEHRYTGRMLDQISKECNPKIDSN